MNVADWKLPLCIATNLPIDGPLWVRTDKTHSEHNESAFGVVADLLTDQELARVYCKQGRIVPLLPAVGTSSGRSLQRLEWRRRGGASWRRTFCPRGVVPFINSSSFFVTLAITSEMGSVAKACLGNSISSTLDADDLLSLYSVQTSLTASLAEDGGSRAKCR
jgi:hypothetical protein